MLDNSRNCSILLTICIRRLAHIIRCEVPLRSVEFLDGLTVVVGGSKGLVYVYDLRSTSKTLSTFTAHTSNVQKVSINSMKFDKMKKSNDSKENILKPSIKAEPYCNHRNRFSTNSSSDESATSGRTNTHYPVSQSEDFSELGPETILEEENVDPFSQVKLEETDMPLLDKDCQPSVEKAVIDMNGNPPIIDTTEECQIKKESEENVNIQDLQDTDEPKLSAEGQVLFDAVEDTRFHLHMDNMTLFAQMIKQFTLMQKQIQELQEQCKTNTDLLLEVQHLREENKRLKTSY